MQRRRRQKPKSGVEKSAPVNVIVPLAPEGQEEPKSRVEKSSDLSLLKHQHDQYIRSLKQSYEMQIQKLRDEHSAHLKTLQKDVTESNRAAIEEVSAQKDAEMQRRIESLKADLSEKLDRTTRAFAEKAQRLEEHKQALQMSRKEAEETRKSLDESMHRLEAVTEERHDMADDLAATKAQLKALKQEAQVGLRDMRNALEVSQEHLTVNYELISSLKSDKQKLVSEVERLRRELIQQEKGIRSYASTRRDLEQRSGSTDMDSQTYREKMSEVSKQEQALSDAARNTTMEIEKNTQYGEQCSAAIRQAQAEMQEEKRRHIALRQDYQEHLDRLTSLNEALERCKEKNISADQIIGDMTARYQALTEEHQRMMKEFDAYRKDNESTETVRKQMQMTPSEAADARKRIQSSHQYAFNSLEACNQRNQICLQASRDQASRISALESELRSAMEIIKGRKEAGGSSSTMPTPEDMVSLRSQIKTLADENSALRDRVRAFADHEVIDKRLEERHSDLRTKHARALQWISDMKQHGDALGAKQTQVERDIESVGTDLNASEESMQQTAANIRALDSRQGELRMQLGQCMYPGEKERLTSQLNDAVRERDALRAQMLSSTGGHSQLHQHLQSLMRENDELKALKLRHDADAEQMAQIAEQGAQLNVDLVEARRLLDKKDKQLGMISSQLSAMLHRVRTLEEREAQLTSKLQQSSTPEEVQSLTGHLNSCRTEMKTHADRFAAAKAAAERLAEQVRLSESKIVSLMQVIRDSESTQRLWANEHAERQQLQAALQECGSERKLASDQLQDRIRAMEELHNQNRESHDRLIADSNARIAELQTRLTSSSETQRQEAMGRLTSADVPMTKPEQVVAVKSQADAVIRRAQNELAVLKSQNTSNPKVAIDAANLDSVRELQRLRALHSQTMREKEREIMTIRDKTYDTLLGTLDVANRDANVNPNDLYSQIRDIRAQGAAREQQAMADMLKLRAINARLGAEYQAARAAQAELLHKANVSSRDAIVQLSSEGAPPPLVQQNAQAYQALVGAHRDYLMSNRRDVTAQLSEQHQYINELQRQAPKMDAIVNSMNLQRFPDLNVFKNQIDQERQFTAGAIGFERKEAVSQDRTQSALEAQLKSLDASVRTMIDVTNRYAKDPSPANGQRAAGIAVMSPAQIQELRQQTAAEADRSALRKTLVSQQRLPSDGPPNKSLAIDRSTGEVRIQAPNAPPGVPAQSFFGSPAGGVAMFNEPLVVFKPSVERSVRAIQSNQDIVVVTYSFDLSKPDRQLKYVLFENALRHIYPRIQELSGNGATIWQLVRVLKNGVRMDMFNTASNLGNSCTYSTCATTKITVQDSSSIDKLLAQLRERKESFTAAGDSETEDHIVLSIGVPGSTAHVHITDVLFTPVTSPDGKINIPAVDSMRLLDGSWMAYLADVIQKKDTKIDLYFNVLPSAADDTVVHASNERILQVSDRIEQYLRAIKGVQAG